MTLIFLDVPPLEVYNQNTVGENGAFQSLRENISPTVSNTATVNRKSNIVDLLWISSGVGRRDLRTCTSVAGLSLHQL